MAIIAVSGTPGTGKTTVARLLAKRLGWRLVCLHQLARDEGMLCGYDRRRRTRIVDVERVKRRILAIPGNLVVESHYAHDIPNDLTIVLHCEISELRRRLRRRRWRASKVIENGEAEIFDVCGEEARERSRAVLDVDTTGKTPEETVSEILPAIRKRLLASKTRSGKNI